MKRTTIVLLFVFVASIAYSQDYQGRILIAPGFNYSTQSDFEKNNDEKNPVNSRNTFNVYIPVGYFLTDRVALGISPGYYSQKSEYTYIINGEDHTNEYKTNRFNIGVFGRHYTKLVDRLNFFAELSLSYGTGKQTSNLDDSDEVVNNLTSFGFIAKPGLSFSLTDKMFIELGIGNINYSHSKSKEKDAPDDSPVEHNDFFGISYNSISFGLMFLL